MSVIVDKKVGNDTSRLRLTIQIDLSGFSFMISNSIGEFLHHYHKDFPKGAIYVDDIEAFLKKEINSHPLLLKEYAAVRVYYDTEKYCLVPNSFFKLEEAFSMLSQLHTIEDLDEVLYVEIPEQSAYMIYAMPNAVTSHIFRIQKNAAFFPLSYFLLDKISLVTEYNRLFAYFTKNMVHIVASDRDRLLLANSYPASDFVTAQYYLFLVLKEVMFNPEVTTLQISGSLSKSEESDLSQYFFKVKRCEL